MNIDTNDENIKKLAGLIKDIKLAMLTTITSNNVIRSRPMATQELEFNGDLWFYTSVDSDKISEISNNDNVNVTYSNSNNKFISVSGNAEIIDDINKIKEMWTPIMKAWFPDEVNDPKIRLIKVKVTNAEYWDNPNNNVVKLVGFVKALTTGKNENLGENKKININ